MFHRSIDVPIPKHDELLLCVCHIEIYIVMISNHSDKTTVCSKVLLVY